MSTAITNTEEIRDRLAHVSAEIGERTRERARAREDALVATRVELLDRAREAERAASEALAHLEARRHALEQDLADGRKRDERAAAVAQVERFLVGGAASHIVSQLRRHLEGQATLLEARANVLELERALGEARAVLAAADDPAQRTARAARLRDQAAPVLPLGALEETTDAAELRDGAALYRRLAELA